MSREPLIVETRSDFVTLRTWRHPRVVVRLADLTKSEIGEWETRLNKLLDECGCSAAAFSMLVCAVLYGIGVGLGVRWLPQHLGTRIGVGVGVLCAGVIAGKVVGIGWARYRYGVAVRQLEQLFVTRHHKGCANATPQEGVHNG